MACTYSFVDQDGKNQTLDANEFKAWLANGGLGFARAFKVADGAVAGNQEPESKKQDKPEQKNNQAAAPVSKTEEIQDFGEKLGGARKDKQFSISGEMSDSDIATQPLSKIWPSDEYLSIDDKYASAVSFVARQEIPAKPRVEYKLKSWVSKVQAARSIANDIASGKVNRDDFGRGLRNSYVLSQFANNVDLLQSIDREQWPRVGSVEVLKNAYRLNDDGTQTRAPLARVSIDGKTHRFDGASSVADIVERVSEILENKEARTTKLQFEVRGYKGTGYSINKKGDKDYRKLKTFETAKEALDYIKTNYDDVAQLWEDSKARYNVKEDDVRNDENRPRTGADHRQGKDVTTEEFAETFGFRGIEFGNWVTQGKNAKERQGMLNQSYDALRDLSDIIGIPPKALSLNGTLGLGFGSRGAGKASAHFEPDTLVINLTKTRGAGTLAHEWFHALDNYFSRMRSDGKGVSMKESGGTQAGYRKENFITYKPEPLFIHKRYASSDGMTKEKLELQFKAHGSKQGGYYDPANWHLDPKHKQGVRPEVERQFAELVNALNESPMALRASRIDKAAEGYWSQIIERGARSFENYVISKMLAHGYQNDYLANVKEVQEFQRDAGRYPYLLPEEVAPISEAFDNLFSTIQTKETDTGVALFSRSPTTQNTHSVSSLTEELSKAFKPVFVKALLANNKFSIITMDDAKKILGDSALFHKVFHGTPHLFKPEPGFPHGRFHLDYIGTGEGAQAYGFGIYFAESPKVAGSYSGKLSNELTYNGKAMQRESGRNSRDAAAWALYLAGGDKATAKASGLAKPELIDALDPSKLKPGGQLYHLDIPDSVTPYLLDWDKPLSEQTKEVREALTNAQEAHGLMNNIGRIDANGEEIYKHFSYLLSESDKSSSEYLASIGIVGNKYLDGQSRADGEGTHNFVIWHQPTLDKIALLERNGEKLDAIQEAQFSQDNGTAQAFYQDGKTYLIADAISKDATHAELNGLLKHEIGVHAMHLGVNDAEFKSILSDMDAMRKSGDKDVIAAYDRAKQAGTKPDDVAHETLAYLVQNAPESPLVARIMAFIKRMINKVLGVANLHWKYTSAELNEMASVALRDFVDSEKMVAEGQEAMFSKPASQLTAEEQPFATTERAYGGREAFDKAKADGKTKLNYNQWVQVRTPEFKAWFGDWENDPADASKVVDENGEPMVVYHGTGADFDRFDWSSNRTILNRKYQGDGFHFSEDSRIASRYADAVRNNQINKESIFTEVDRVMPTLAARTFKSVVNDGYRAAWDLPDAEVRAILKESDEAGIDLNDLLDIAKYVEGSNYDKGRETSFDAGMIFGGSGAPEVTDWVRDDAVRLGLDAAMPKNNVMPVFIKAKKVLRTSGRNPAKNASKNGYDAVYYTGDDLVGGVPEWIVYHPTQIKSATGNTGAFDGTNPDIRYSFGGENAQTADKYAPSLESQTIKVSRIQSIADDLAKSWKNAPKIVSVASMEDTAIPEIARQVDADMRKKGAKGNPKGFFYEGTVYVIASEHNSIKDVIETLYHEVAHAGLRGKFGIDLKPILQQIVTMRRKDVDAKIKEYGLSMDSDIDKLTAAEEVLAEMAQSNPKIGFVKRAVAIIRTWLRNNFHGLSSIYLTDAEIIKNYLIPAKDFIERGYAHGAHVSRQAVFARKFSKEEKKSAVKRYVDGESVYDITKDIGVGAVSFYDWLKADGIETHGGARKLSDIDRTKAIEMYSEGKSTLEVAREFGVNQSTINSYLKNAGIDRRQPTPDPALVAEAKRLYESGLSLEKVADQTGRGATTILNWLKSDGVQTRPRAGYDENIKAEAIRLYSDGMSASEVSKRLGLGEKGWAVRDWADKAGIGRTLSEATSLTIRNGRVVYSGINTPWQSEKTGRWEIAHSTYELLRMEQLDSDSDVTDWSKKTPLVKYTDASGKQRTYVPDFLVKYKDGRTVVEEVKPEFQLLDKTVIAKLDAARKQFSADGIEFRVLTQHDIGIDGIKENYRKLRAAKDKNLRLIENQDKHYAEDDAGNAAIRVEPYFSRSAAQLQQSQLNTQNNILTSAKNWLANRGEDLMPASLGVLTMRHLEDLSKERVPEFTNYVAFTDRMQSDRNTMLAESSKEVDAWQTWAGKNRAMNAVLTNIMSESTIYGMRPDLPYKALNIANLQLEIDELNDKISKSTSPASISAMQEKADGISSQIAFETSGKRRAKYGEIKNTWDNNLNQKARDIYDTVRNMYLNRSDMMFDALKGKIMRSQITGKSAFVSKLRAEYEQRKFNGVYFPLMRFGDYWLDAKDTQGERIYMMFDTAEQLRSTERNFKAQGFTDMTTGRKVDDSSSSPANVGFLHDVLGKVSSTLGASPEGDALRDEIYQVFLRSLPDMSVRKAFIHRKNVAGFSDDAIRGFAVRTQHMAHQLARMRVSQDLEESMQTMRDHVKANPDTKTSALFNEIQKTHQWVMNPTDSEITNKLTALGFLWYLGASPAAAAVNMTQLMTVTAPVLMAKHGVKSIKALGDAMPGAMGRGLSQAETAMIDVLRKAGAIDDTMVHDQAGVGASGTMGYNPIFSKAMNIVGWMFQAAEVFNRKTTAIAAYRLAISNGETVEAATEYARSVIYESHFDYSNLNRARYMRPNIAKVLLLFKQYSLNVSYYLLRNAYLSMKGETEQAKREAMIKLGGTMAVTMTTAGIAGVPLFAPIAALVGLFAGGGDPDKRWDAEDELYAWIKKNYGSDVANMVINGVMNKALGVDIASRTSLGELWIRSPSRDLEGKALAHHYLEQLAGPVLGIPIGWLGGLQLMQEGHFERGLEKMVPKAARDLMTSARFFNEGALNMDSEPLVSKQDMTLLDVLAKSQGFTPARLAEVYDENERVKNAERFLQKRRQQIINQAWLAKSTDDKEAWSKNAEAVKKWNSEYPLLRIKPSTLHQSFKIREKNMKNAENGIIINKNYAPYVEKYR